MTEYGKDHIERKDKVFQVGKSKIEWKDDRIEIHLDELATPIPRRVKGRITLKSDKFFLYSTWLDDEKKHRWGPIAPNATVEV